MHEQEAQPGLVELIEYLERRGVRMGLCTRNFEWVFEPCFISRDAYPREGVDDG